MSHLRREFLKVLLQKRTYFGWAGLFAIPFIVAVAVYFNPGDLGPRGAQQGSDFYFETISANGLYVAIVAIAALALFLLPLLAAVSGSQTIAGEAEKGTLRTTLMQPVRRGGLLAAKWLVANFYVAIGLVILLVGSLIAGGAFFGIKPMLLLSLNLSSVGVAHSLGLIALLYLFVWFAMAAAVSLALLFSTLTDSGLTAVAGSMVLVIIMIVLGGIPSLDFLDPYLFTSYFTGSFPAWLNFFTDPITWGPIREAIINFAVWIAVTTAAAWVIFRRKDVHS